MLGDRVTRLLLAPFLLLLAAGCGDEASGSGGGGGSGGGEAGGPPTSPCPPGQRELANGACLETGTQESGCAAGEWADEDGICVPAGIGPGGCGEGFVHDGDVGCDPILPADGCGPGTWAIPGDTACRDFTDCGPGPFPEGLPAGDIVYVDAAAKPPFDGSLAAPYDAIQDAVDAAVDGATIAVAAGSYDEAAVEGKALVIWGRCASMVTVDPGGDAGLTFGPGSSGSEARGLAIAGEGRGLVVNDAEGVVLHDLWLHDLTSDGLTAERLLAPTEATVSNALIDAATGRATYAVGATLTVEELAIRDTQPNTSGMGRAVDTDLQPATGESNLVTVRRIHVERSQEVAMMVHASTATVIDSFFSDTLPKGNGRVGRGINIQTDTADHLPSLTILGSVIDGAYDGGIVGTTGSIVMSHTVVRHIEPNLDDGFRGYGVAVQGLPLGDTTLKIDHCLIEAAREMGVFTAGATTTLESVVIRDMVGLTGVDYPGLPANFGGRGISTQSQGTGIPSSLTMRGCVVENNQEVGIGAFGSELLVEGTLVERHRPVAMTTVFGRGVVVQADVSTGVLSNATIRDSVIRDSTEVGLFVSGSVLDADGVLVEETKETLDGLNGVGISVNRDGFFAADATATVANVVVTDSVTAGVGLGGAAMTLTHALVDDVVPASQLGGIYGDGVSVTNLYGGLGAMSIHDAKVAGAARGGVSVFGAQVELSATAIECADIDLPIASLGEADPVVVDLGGNRCGCGQEVRTCKAISSELEVPEPPGSF